MKTDKSVMFSCKADGMSVGKCKMIMSDLFIIWGVYSESGVVGASAVNGKKGVAQLAGVSGFK